MRRTSPRVVSRSQLRPKSPASGPKRSIAAAVATQSVQRNCDFLAVPQPAATDDRSSMVSTKAALAPVTCPDVSSRQASTAKGADAPSSFQVPASERSIHATGDKREPEAERSGPVSDLESGCVAENDRCCEGPDAPVQDFTVEDLNGLIEFYLHLPKEMSPMAKTMYS